MFKKTSVRSLIYRLVSYFKVCGPFMGSNFFVVQQFCGRVVLSNVSDQLYGHLLKFMFILVKLLYK